MSDLVTGAADPALPPGFVAGNHFDKYRSKNPVHRALVGRFLRDARELVQHVGPSRILEVGCGPGDLASNLFGTEDLARQYVGVDISPEEVAKARRGCPGRDFRVATTYNLPFEDRSFDLVLACEVFEHLERPEEALREVERVCAAHLLLSVPWEPAWRVFNVLRGKYVASLGNTPGHVQHFSRRAIRSLVGTRFDIVAERRPPPWTMLLAHRRGQTSGVGP